MGRSQDTDGDRRRRSPGLGQVLDDWWRRVGERVAEREARRRRQAQPALLPVRVDQRRR